MKFRNLRNLAAKCFISASAFFFFGINAAHAGIPVIDGTNLTQNVMTALQTAESYAQQLQQYATQLQQYETQLKNTVAPAAYVWDQAQQTINKATQIINQVQTLRDSNGALTTYLNTFKNASYYSTSPCFKATGCPNTTYNTMLQNAITGSNATKEANDAWLRQLDAQQAQLQNDAANLAALQNVTPTAIGQMQAMQTANQISSSTANNLLQLRAIIIAQSQAAAARAQADADKAAQQTAASQYIHKATFTASPDVSY